MKKINLPFYWCKNRIKQADKSRNITLQSLGPAFIRTHCIQFQLNYNMYQKTGNGKLKATFKNKYIC